MHGRVLLSLVVASLALAVRPAPGQEGNVDKDVVPVVGTHYFYWYRHPGEHITNQDGSDALAQHFADPRLVDWSDPDFHRTQVEWMMEAELDFFCPVYWPGAPFADAGLEAILRALKRIVDDGGRPPKIAMFYDTTPLLSPVKPGEKRSRLDLTKDADRALFYSHALKFFETVPRTMWFEFDGFPIICLYSSFGAQHGRGVLEGLSDAFKAKFGKRPFVIAEESWNARSHARYRWGSALSGPTGDSVVQTLGPGYDDRPVPGRSTPIREREDTRFYMWSWNEVLLRHPSIVLVETWNEFHEGSGIAPCVEYGRSYVDVTRRFTKRLKRRLMPDEKRPVRLAYPDPLPRPDRGWWQRRPGTTSINLVADYMSEHGFGDGLRIADVADGPWSRETVGDQRLVNTAEPRGGVTYLYLAAADEYAFRHVGAVEITLDLIDGGNGSVELHYDSWDEKAPVAGAYKSAPRHARRGTLSRRRIRWTLPDARFGNRQNGGADFRFAIRGDVLSLNGIKVRSIDGDGVTRPTLSVDD